jgi:hypothetical protein
MAAIESVCGFSGVLFAGAASRGFAQALKTPANRAIAARARIDAIFARCATMLE